MNTSKATETVIRLERREDGNNEYTYELLLREDTKTASFKMPLYSIRINMTTSDGVSTSASVKDIFADVRKAGEFYDKLVRYLATPIDLRYIVEDELG